jgi:hypothetical protein
MECPECDGREFVCITCDLCGGSGEIEKECRKCGGVARMMSQTPARNAEVAGRFPKTARPTAAKMAR